MRIVLRKSGTAKPDEKMGYFKKLILDHLKGSESQDDEEELKKAGLPVGTIHTYKNGKKYVKSPSGKWIPKYDSHTRGAKMAVSAIRKKVDQAKTSKDLMNIVMQNRDRFSDPQGNPLPFVQELSKYVEARGDQINFSDNAKAIRKENRSKAIKEGQKKERDKREEARKAGEENKRQKAERIKQEQEKENAAADPEKSEEEEKPVPDDSQDGVDLQALRDKYQGGKIIEGNEDEIYVGDESMKGRWKLVEADAPSASHDETTFNKTRGFPKNEDGSTINDRDYQNDRAAQETVMSIGSNFDGRALSFDSPVVVSQDGIVISGNNRTMSSKIAAKKGTDTKYVDALKKRAARFGLSEEDIEGFRHPRVVFEIEKDGDYSTGEFAKYNQSEQKGMSPVEAAVKVSKTIKVETVKDIAGNIAEFDTVGELYTDQKACMNIFNALETGGIINKFNRVTYISPEGAITGAGKEFLETVMLGVVVSEPNLRGLNREGCKHIRAKLMRAITPLVNNKSLDGYSIMSELNQAIDIFMQFNIEKDKFGTLDDLAKQGTMFEEPSKVAIELAKKMQMNQKDFADFLQKMNASLEIGASGQSDIFLGEIESKDDVLKRVLSFKKAIQGVLEKLKKGKYGPNFEFIETPGIQKAQGEPHYFDVALDFDGVINSYKNGWKGATEMEDPVPGAAEGIKKLIDTGLEIAIYSTRANTPEGEKAIRDYLRNIIGDELSQNIEISDSKPIAAVYVDDRAITFSGNWEEIPDKIKEFKSWVEKSLTWSGYKLQGRAKFQGMDISIENKKGSVRSGTDKNGHEWSIKMNFDYGYIRGTVGKDKDHLDAYIGPNPDSDMVFVVHQNDPGTGAYDEDKVMLGFDSEDEARKAYLSQYDRPGFLGEIDTMDIETFKEKAFNEKNKGKRLE